MSMKNYGRSLGVQSKPWMNSSDIVRHNNQSVWTNYNILWFVKRNYPQVVVWEGATFRFVWEDISISCHQWISLMSWIHGLHASDYYGTISIRNETISYSMELWTLNINFINGIWMESSWKIFMESSDGILSIMTCGWAGELQSSWTGGRDL